MTKLRKIEFPKSTSIAACEQIVSQCSLNSTPDSADVLVASSFGRAPFLDTWVAMAIGSVLSQGGDAFLWGIGEASDHATQRFVSYPPGLAATFLSDNLCPQGDKKPIDRHLLKHWIETSQRGSLEGEDRGSERMLIEFGAQRSVTVQSFDASRGVIDEKAFELLLHHYHRELAFWRSVGPHPARPGEAGKLSQESRLLKKLGKYFYELFDNAYKYGSISGDQIEDWNQIRFMRLRKIVGSRDQLIERSENSVSGISDYISNTLRKRNLQVLIELSISDFGLGILDQFLSTGAGKRFTSAPRGAILEKLLFEKLTSNPLDPQAGEGLSNALEAASDLGAFVSLRTGEFHYTAAFDEPGEVDRFKPLSERGALGRVRGTHWQFLLAPPF
jgi:hypothetical protein